MNTALDVWMSMREKIQKEIFLTFYIRHMQILEKVSYF